MQSRLKRTVFACGVPLLLSAIPASATTVSGWAWKTRAYPDAVTAGTNVSICTNANGTGMCYRATTSQHCYGAICNSGWYSITVPDGYYWYLFVSDPRNDWGSDSSPALGSSGMVVGTRFYFSGPIYGGGTIDLYSAPAPHVPSAIYPTNRQENAPYNFTLKWTSGSDAERNLSLITYDIYAHGEGGTDLLQASNLSCNPDASDNCTMAVSGVMSSAYYYWHVVAKMNPGYFAPNPYYTTRSPDFTFTTATNPSALISFMTADNAHYLSGSGCGGSSLVATPISIGGCESFKVIDLNGGSLISGDSVNVQLGNLWYVAAEGSGGGDVNVNRTSATERETFTIVKVFGAPGSRILNGDRVAFQTSNGNYISAVNYGGSSVNAYPTSPGPAEWFVYAVHF